MRELWSKILCMIVGYGNGVSTIFFSAGSNRQRAAIR